MADLDEKILKIAVIGGVVFYAVNFTETGGKLYDILKKLVGFTETIIDEL